MADDQLLTSALTGDMELLIEDQFQSMSSLFLAGKPVSTLSLDGKGKFIYTPVALMPNQMYATTLYTAKFDNGLVLRCSPNTNILTLEGFKPVSSLSTDTQILGGFYNGEVGLTGKIMELTGVEKQYKLVAEPCYGFIAKGGNILIPHFGGADENQLTFVCIS